MADTNKFDKKIRELSKKLSKEKALSEELAQLSEIIENMSDIEDGDHFARWPYVDASTISEAVWRAD
jgi:hypothetical protein